MGSGAGVAAVGSGVADIGAASEVIASKWTTQFPNLKSNLIGYGAIVVITNKAAPGVAVGGTGTTVGSISQDDCDYVWDPTNTTGNTGATTHNITANFVPVYRADGSGTADSFFGNFVNMSKQYGGPSSSPASNSNNTRSLAVNGNAAVVSTVGSTPLAIGFADYGDTLANILGGNPTVTIVPIVKNDGSKIYFNGKTFDGTTVNPACRPPTTGTYSAVRQSTPTRQRS